MHAAAATVIILIFWYIVHHQTKKSLQDRFDLLMGRFDGKLEGNVDPENLDTRHQFNMEASLQLAMIPLIAIRCSVTALTQIVAAVVIIGHIFP